MNDKIIKQIKRLIYASDAFQQAEALLLHIQTQGLEVNDSLYNPMMAGVVTTYGINFNKANGLGPLPSFYEEFDDPKLQESHFEVVAARNQLYAHRDIQNTKDKKDGAYKVAVWIENGRLLFQPAMIDISHNKIADIQSLISFQRNRLQDDLDKKLSQVIDRSKLYDEGVRWEFGIGFP